jgi:hypothetical protein
LIAKIEGCEETHQYMVQEGLNKRGVNIENYYRFNVEIGVGEFGMNEWNRLADISTGTRRYLGKSEIQRLNLEAAAKLAKIHRAKARFEVERTGMGGIGDYKGLQDVPEAYPTAIELPAEVPAAAPSRTPPPRPSYESGHHDTLEVPGSRKTPSPRSSGENHSRPSPRTSAPSIPGPNADRFVVHAPTPSEHRTAAGADIIAITSTDERQRPKPTERVEPPPLPPKTPIPGSSSLASMGRQRPPLPYPVDDGPPPAVNMARKPDYKGR